MALDHPDDTVRAAVYPVVNEATLRDLVREGAADREQAFRPSTDRAPFLLLGPLPWMLPRLLGSMEFVCNNTAYRPVMDALALLKSYAERSGKQRFYSPTDQAPLEGVVPAEWRDAVVDEHGAGENGCLMSSARYGHCARPSGGAQVWVVGANRWRDPEADLPRTSTPTGPPITPPSGNPSTPRPLWPSCARTSAPLSTASSGRLPPGRPEGWRRVVTRHGEPWISVPAPVKQAEPANLVALKQQVEARWGTIDLLDVLKEADYLSGFTAELTSVASREATDGPRCDAGCCWCASRSGPAWG